MFVKDYMDQKVARVSVNSTMKFAAELLVLTQSGELFIVDEEGAFQGVVSEGDIIRAVMPDFDEVIESGGSMNDAFRIFIETGKDLAGQSIKRLIISNPITVSPDDALLKVATVMIEKMIRRLPVVENNKFLGTISRADLCWAILR